MPVLSIVTIFNYISALFTHTATEVTVCIVTNYDVILSSCFTSLFLAATTLSGKNSIAEVNANNINLVMTSPLCFVYCILIICIYILLKSIDKVAFISCQCYFQYATTVIYINRSLIAEC